MSARSLPTALYIGLPRAGSTWMSEVLRQHPDVFVPAVKDVYFFDREYSRGLDWYSTFFQPGATRKVRIEFSHDYFHVPFTPARVRSSLPDVRLLLTLREPVSWVRSTYQNMRRNGRAAGGMGFVLSEQLGLVAGGLYSEYLRLWLEAFPRDQLSLFLFDDLRDDPDAFYGTVLEALGLPVTPLPDTLAEPVNAAAEARWGGAARAVRSGAQVVRGMGKAEWVGRVKRNATVRRVLYRQAEGRVDFDGDVREGLQEFFRQDVHRLSELSGLDLVGRWGY